MTWSPIHRQGGELKYLDLQFVVRTRRLPNTVLRTLCERYRYVAPPRKINNLPSLTSIAFIQGSVYLQLSTPER